MIKSLQGLLGKVFSQEAPGTEERQSALNLAAAALMIEVARADFREDVAENERIFALLKQTFSLPPEAAELLMEQASQKVDESVSLYEFTRLINDRLGDQEKRQVIKLMWQVAYADHALHRYEEHMVRKVAELLYVPNAELLRMRQEARDESGGRQDVPAGD